MRIIRKFGCGGSKEWGRILSDIFYVLVGISRYYWRNTLAIVAKVITVLNEASYVYKWSTYLLFLLLKALRLKHLMKWVACTCLHYDGSDRPTLNGTSSSKTLCHSPQPQRSSVLHKPFRYLIYHIYISSVHFTCMCIIHPRTSNTNTTLPRRAHF